MKVITTPRPVSDDEIIELLFEALGVARKERVVAISYSMVVDRGEEYGQEWNHYSLPDMEEELEEVAENVLKDIEADVDAMYFDYGE